MRKVYQTRSSNAREKVKYIMWTNDMDGCLSKVLVDHSKKGCKSDNVIKPVTYAAAVNALNDQFGLELTKEHIKNRLKTWRKQYIVLKEVLAQKGFKWDKARKMVVATDAVWNNYIKVYPDAKQLRSKSIANYDELCIIVGNDQEIASENYCEGDEDLITENEVVGTPFEPEIQSDDKLTKNLRWTRDMDYCLGTTLMEQVQKGHKIDNVLLPQAYEAAVTALKWKFGPDLTKDHIRNRLKTLKKQYVILKELLSHPEFKWDETQNMIIGSDLVWDDYIKSHHDARVFRGKVVENYNHLFTIFSNSPATRIYSRTTDDIVQNFVGDSEGVEAINAPPVQCWGSSKDQAKNIRWTIEMDQYLSKILVEQVKLGHKSNLDNKFMTEAYVAAVSALCDNFQLNFTTDNVKYRIKTWKKLYDNVKALLGQSEFKWDKTRKMVIASDSAWLDYVKINPNVRLLQGRVIANYDDLCVIIGNDEPAESFRTDADLDWAGDIGIEANFDYHNYSDRSRESGKYIIWTNEMDRLLTEKLVEQVKLGNKLVNNFKPVAYTTMITALNDNFALDLTKENIVSRLETWRQMYLLVKELLSYRGFKWDERQNMIVANDSVWNDYIQSHADAKFLRGRSIDNYNELHFIFGNPTYTNEELTETPLTNIMVGEEISLEITDEDIQGSSQQTRGRPSSSSRSKQPLKKRRVSDAMVEMMSAMATNVGRIADALAASNQSVYLDEVFEMVQNIPGFDDDLMIEACEFLSFDEKRAKMFLKLNERLRKMWLLKRLRGNSN